MKGKLIKIEDGKYDLLIESDLDILKGHKLSLKNCQAIERGYDLDELAEQNWRVGLEEYIPTPNTHVTSFKAGFQKALKILGDRKFSEEDVISMIEKSRETGLTAEYLILTKQQNEWEVEVEMDICGDKVYAVPEPKLDADGCLILKRVV